MNPESAARASYRRKRKRYEQDVGSDNKKPH
jgi:hypothetical protein